MYITLLEAKKHLNIDEDFHEDDAYLTSLITVAENVVIKHLDKEGNKMSLFGGQNCPPNIKQATLMLIGHFYSNRESTTYASNMEIPLGYKYLLSLDIKDSF